MTQPTLPTLHFPPALPITERLDEIRDAINTHQVIVLCGETGCGKSTQLPKICLSLGLGELGRIGHTQPRRMAAQRLAERVSDEIQQPIGECVGYKIRFADKTAKKTRVKLMTDGILLAEIQQDRQLREYSALIIDEAHERSLNIDFLLGYLHQLLPKRPDLKVIITSATLEPERFAKHFGQAPIIHVSGRTYPVEIRYRPPSVDPDTNVLDRPQALVDAVAELSCLGPRGDILVFFAGERDIHEAADHLRKHHGSHADILPLYARQRMADQTAIFQPSGHRRRIILATNVAETSLTVPGIKYVIDTGKARISRYSSRSKLQRLPIEPISQASAAQRTGRCGRVSAGVCIRLFSEPDFQQRPAFTEPEILRTNLAAIILRMQSLGFGDVARYPFVQPPDRRLIKDGYRVLHELGATDTNQTITPLGRKLARLPVDPRIGRMLIAATKLHCLREILIIAAVLAVQDPRERPRDQQQAADQAQVQFNHPHSDFLSLLNLWNYLEEARTELSRRKFEQLCRRHYLAVHRVREWSETRRQLEQQMRALHYHPNAQPASENQISQAILSGLLSQIGLREQGKNQVYQGARNSRFHLLPGSGQSKSAPRWVVAAELVETQRVYARTVARIQPAWLETLASHLIKPQYAEPYWNTKTGQVLVQQSLVLYGLPIVTGRRINYGDINPKQAHEIFIQHALVEAELCTKVPFWRHNQALIATVQAEEAKVRRRDLLIDSSQQYAWYAERIPAQIHSTTQLEAWLRQPARAQHLHQTLDDLRATATSPSATDYPDDFLLNGTPLPLSYQFAPGEPTDGVTLNIPLTLLHQLSIGQADWLVPGMINEKLTILLKGLPKALRRQCVPIAETVQDCLAMMQPEPRPLHQTLAATIKKQRGILIPEEAWNLSDLAPHLQLRICVMDASGKQTLATSRDIIALQQKHTCTPASIVAPRNLQHDNLRDWTCGTLPPSVQIKQQGLTLKAYPALVDNGTDVSVQCLASAEQAVQAHQMGLCRLYQIRQAQFVREVRRKGIDQTTTWQYDRLPGPSPVQSTGLNLTEQIIQQAFIQAFFADIDPSQIRDQASFLVCYDQGKSQVRTVYEQLKTIIKLSIAARQTVQNTLQSLQGSSQQAAVQDIQQQLDRLIYPGFVSQAPAKQLQHYRRYLQAMEQRLHKLQQGGQARDQQSMQAMAELQQRWVQRIQQHTGEPDPRLEQIRWQLEELRVSLFAQAVGTPEPVSVRRIQKCWEQLGL